jgi:Uma2 family endonuclease
MTPEEFDAVDDYDEQFSYELINGVVVVTPIADEAEADPVDELGFLLRDYQRNHPAGSALDTTMPDRYIKVSGSRRKADRVLWAGLGRLPDPDSDVATIVVEFVSRRKRDRTRDYVTKKHEYLAAGVQEYWIIDRFLRQMTVVRPGPSGPAEQVVPESGTYSTPLLPGFELPLAKLLARADAWR